MDNSSQLDEHAIGINKGEEATAEQTEWDEERIDLAQKSLKDMYFQLRNLRSTLPKLVAPLMTNQPSPEALVHQLSAAVITANSEIKQFRTLFESEDSKNIFEHAKKSRAQNAKGITPWRITEDPSWFKKD